MSYLEPIIIIILLLALASLAVGAASLVVWLPTRKKDLPRLLSLLKPAPDETIYELGAGDGRVALYLAERLPQSRIIGLEIAWPLYLVCRLRQFFGGARNLAFKNRDLFKEDLSPARTVYVFGIPDKLKDKLAPKLKQELSPGSRVISYAFAIGGWRPEKIDRPDQQSMPIYLYILPCFD